MYTFYFRLYNKPLNLTIKNQLQNNTNQNRELGKAYKSISCTHLQYLHNDISDEIKPQAHELSKNTPWNTAIIDNNNKITIKVHHDENADNRLLNSTQSAGSIQTNTEQTKESESSVAKNKLENVASTSSSSTSSSPTISGYNEKAIDVPEDFEREAYARRAIRDKSINACQNRVQLRRQLRSQTRSLNPTLKDFLQVSLF